MFTSTLTSQGQATIPAGVRNFLKIEAGDRLEYLPQEDGTVMIVPATIDVRELKGMLPKPCGPVSIEEMNRTMRKHVADSVLDS